MEETGLASYDLQIVSHACCDACHVSSLFSGGSQTPHMAFKAFSAGFQAVHIGDLT